MWEAIEMPEPYAKQSDFVTDRDNRVGIRNEQTGDYVGGTGWALLGVWELNERGDDKLVKKVALYGKQAG